MQNCFYSLKIEMIYPFLNNLLKLLNMTIIKATGRVNGNIDPNIMHSSESELKNLYNSEEVSPQSNK